MKLLIEEKGNTRYKITIDTKDNEIRLKLKKGDSKEKWNSAIRFAHSLCFIDFPISSTVRGGFNDPELATVLFRKGKGGAKKWPVEIKTNKNGIAIKIKDRETGRYL